MSRLSPTQTYVRDASFAAVSRDDKFYFCKPNGEMLEVSPVDAQWLASRLERAVVPVIGRVLLEDASTAQAKTLGELLDEGVLVPAARARKQRPLAKPCRHLVLGISGAVQALHASSLAVPLLYQFCERLDLILTPGAQKFVVPDAFRYFGIGVWTDAFAPQGEVRVPHVHLAQSAELVLVAPASASAVQRLASGACSDLLSLVVAATEAPVVIAPSMNSVMWRKKAIARNVAQLRADGFFVVEPSVGLEVSAGANPTPEQGGMGLTPQTLLPVLNLVLALGRKR